MPTITAVFSAIALFLSLLSAQVDTQTAIAFAVAWFWGLATIIEAVDS